MDALYVGIDVSKDRLDAHCHPSGESFVAERNGAGLGEFVAKFRSLAPSLIAVEATDGLETVVAAALAGEGMPVVATNPTQVRHYAQALGKGAKTGPFDAAIIARFAEATKPTVRALPDETKRLLAGLVARRRQIVEMMGAGPTRRGGDSLGRLLLPGVGAHGLAVLRGHAREAGHGGNFGGARRGRDVERRLPGESHERTSFRGAARRRCRIRK